TAMSYANATYPMRGDTCRPLRTTDSIFDLTALARLRGPPLYWLTSSLQLSSKLRSNGRPDSNSEPPIQRKPGAISRRVIEHDWLRIPYREMKIDGKPLRYVESNRLSIKRLETLLSKEPTTIPWLDSFSSGDIFVDIGANVGMYSIYAAVLRDARVYAFE